MPQGMHPQPETGATTSCLLGHMDTVFPPGEADKRPISHPTTDGPSAPASTT